MFFKAFIVSAVLSGLASAISISPQCQSTLLGLVSSPDAACLNPSGLVGLVIGGNNSIVSTVNSWLTTTCGLDPCSNSSLSAVVTNVTSGCSTELSALNVTSSSASQLVPEVQQAYPTVRKVACLQHTTNNTLCVTETLNNVQSVVGTLSIANVFNVIAQLSSLSSLPQNVVCTDCIKESYNLFKAELPNTAASAAGPLQSECGASFINGQVPSDVTETAKGTRLSNSNGASLMTAGGAVVMLVLVSSGFALLA